MARSRLAFVALCASIFALSVIALGALTRLIDAGLGCPDWPGCYGHFIVPSASTDIVKEWYPNTPLVAYKGWAEMIHRYCVGGLSILIVVLVAAILKNFLNKTRRSWSNLFLACGLILLLCYQILLGRWTVTLKLLPLIVTQHLLGGFLILSILWLIYLNNSHFESKSVTQAKKISIFFCALGIILLLIQITLGAWTSTNYAALSCPDFPFCMHHENMMWQIREAFHLSTPIGINYEGGTLPTSIRQTIQMTHRLGALILTIYLFAFLIMIYYQLKSVPQILKAVFFIMVLLTVQLCLGISNVIFKLPLVTAVLHNLVAVMLLLSMLTLIVKLISLKQETFI